jgi:hypothetical protein
VARNLENCSIRLAWRRLIATQRERVILRLDVASHPIQKQTGWVGSPGSSRIPQGTGKGCTPPDSSSAAPYHRADARHPTPSPSGIEKWFTDMPPVRIAMEAGTYSIWISGQTLRKTIGCRLCPRRWALGTSSASLYQGLFRASIFFAASESDPPCSLPHCTNRNSMPSFASGGCHRERYRAVSARARVRMTASAPRSRAA